MPKPASPPRSEIARKKRAMGKNDVGKITAKSIADIREQLRALEQAKAERGRGGAPASRPRSAGEQRATTFSVLSGSFVQQKGRSAVAPEEAGTEERGPPGYVDPKSWAKGLRR